MTFLTMMELGGGFQLGCAGKQGYQINKGWIKYEVQLSNFSISAQNLTNNYNLPQKSNLTGYPVFLIAKSNNSTEKSSEEPIPKSQTNQPD